MTPTLESIWGGFASQLRGFVRSRIRDHAAAEDIMQEVFVKIHRKLPTLLASGRIEAWIWRIARNAIADHFRRLRPNEPLPDELSATPDDPTGMPDISPCVRRFVGELAPHYREALQLTEWEGLTQEQMAQRLGLSLSCAKSRVQRARGQLKALLLDCCRLEFDRRGNVLEMQPRLKKCDSAC